MRRSVARVLEAALRAADPHIAVRGAVTAGDHRFTVQGAAYDLRTVRRLFVLGGGKAGAVMAAALEDIFESQIAGGIVSVKYGHAVPTTRVRVLEAGHPLPDAAGVAAAAEVLALAEQAGAEDLVFVVISGGGSALLTAPVPEISLEDKLAVTRLLLESGAPIGELNAVRKHLSRIKGGQLARALAPARSVTLILSDVLGNPLDVIASGPTVPDPTTFPDALAVLRRRGVWARLPAPARDHLAAGPAGRAPETPKPGDPIFDLTHAVVIGDITVALRAAAAAARAEGFTTVVLSATVEGEACVVGAALGRAAKEARTGHYGELPICLLQGGETTVIVRGTGKGGRNQEVALGAALEIAGLPDTLVLSAGTDGTDGPTDAAGAVADGTTLARARAQGLNSQDALTRNDSYHFFGALGDLLITGPTLTNVNDLMMAFVGVPPTD